METEGMVHEFVLYLKKWGLWEGTAIRANGKYYCFGKSGEVEIWKEKHTEEVMEITMGKTLDNLLRYGMYEVRVGKLSVEAIEYIFGKGFYEEGVPDEEAEIDGYMVREFQWMDLDEFTSYEEWQDVTQYCEGTFDVTEEELPFPEFTSAEEYRDFLGKLVCIKEKKIRDYVEEEYYDDGETADYVRNEFDSLVERQGLRYVLGASQTITMYEL